MGEIQFIIKSLVSNKEELKNKVVDNSISWKERMELYSRIHKINEQIEELQQASCSTNFESEQVNS